MKATKELAERKRQAVKEAKERFRASREEIVSDVCEKYDISRGTLFNN
jgi:hypothetical protein